MFVKTSTETFLFYHFWANISMISTSPKIDLPLGKTANFLQQLVPISRERSGVALFQLHWERLF